MSESGWTTVAAEPPIPGSGAEVRPLNHHHTQSDGNGNAPGVLPPEDEPAHEGEPEPSRRPAGAWFPLTREARIGTAALLSFLILVTALVVQKWRHPSASGKQPPVAKIASPEVVAAASTAQPPKNAASIPGHPDKANGTDKDQQGLASETLTPLVPTVPAVASDSPVAPALKVPSPGTELAQYTPPAGTEPALPPATTSAPESSPAEAAAPVTVPPTDLPAAMSPAPGPAPAASASVEVPPSSTGSEALGPIAEEKNHSDQPSLPAPGQGPAPVASPLPSPSPSEPLPGAVEAGIGAGIDASVVPAPFNPPPSTPVGNPDPDSPPKRSPKAQKKKGSQAPTDPVRQPAAIAADPSSGAPRSSELPNFAAAPEPVDPLGAGPPTANPFTDPAASAGQGGWVQLPNAAIRQGDAEALKGRGGAGGSERAHAGAASIDAGTFAESVPHVVASGENFFSIAQKYYGSGRFYPALWKANSDLVSAPEKLRVNQTIRIPPPEALDRSQILPPRTASASGSQPATAVSRSPRPGPAAGRSSAVALALPVADPFSDRPSPGDRALPQSGSSSERSRLPRYKIRPQETLRSIARDTLGDSRRAGEILELNREVIDDPNYLTTGQEIELPEDARLARRVR